MPQMRIKGRDGETRTVSLTRITKGEMKRRVEERTKAANYFPEPADDDAEETADR